ncbi:MAG: DUF1552 domain-containing protein [Myxococcaceae bacterium]|nr:DUF1552 domain-containing protein [Myxococcaceae bacterium]
MSPFRLHRRALLRGAFGAALGLPLLEAMLDASPALAQTTAAARRFVVLFGGFSLGADGDPMHNDLVPTTTGKNYALRTATQPFAAYGAQSLISIVSGLRMPETGAGAVRFNWHGGQQSPLLSGVSSTSQSDAQNARIGGPTSDQLVADAFVAQGVKTPFASLQLKVQAKMYSPGPSQGDIISQRAGANGALQPLSPIVSPRQVFDKLFFGATAPSAQTVAAQAALRRERAARRSVLDFCAVDRANLLGRVGQADAQRLGAYFEQCRALEKQLDALDAMSAAAPTCTTPAQPAADPPLGADSNVSLNNGATYSDDSGSSNEDLRAKVMVDLLVAAFQCDLTRVASVTVTQNQSFLNMFKLTGQRSDVHALSHYISGPPSTTAMAKAQGWHYGHFARLVSLLRDAKDATGASLLASSALAFVNEGGHGPADFGGAAGGAHSSENMVALIAGGAGGLRQGEHVPAPGKHPAQVLLTLMQAVGVSRPGLGELTGALPGLFT